MICIMYLWMKAGASRVVGGLLVDVVVVVVSLSR